MKKTSRNYFSVDTLGLFLIFLVYLTNNAFAFSQLKVICDIDGEKIYIDKKFKAICNAGDPVYILIPAGKHNLEVRKDNKDGSYYYFTETIELGDNVRITITVDSNIVYTEDYYWKKAKNNNNPKNYWLYLKRFPRGKYVSFAKQWLDDFYWEKCKTCETLQSCEEYIKKIIWSKKKIQALQNEELCYLKNENPQVYWEYLKKFPNGNFVKKVEHWLENYYYNKCTRKDSLEACNIYLNKIYWGKRKTLIKQKVDEILCKKAQKDIKSLEEYIIQNPNSVCSTLINKKLIIKYYMDHCENIYCFTKHIKNLGFNFSVTEIDLTKNFYNFLKNIIPYKAKIYRLGDDFNRKGYPTLFKKDKYFYYYTKVHFTYSKPVIQTASFTTYSDEYEDIDILIPLNYKFKVLGIKKLTSENLDLLIYINPYHFLKEKNGSYIRLTSKRLIKEDINGEEIFNIAYLSSLKRFIKVKRPDELYLHRKKLIALANDTYILIGSFFYDYTRSEILFFAKFKVERGFWGWDLKFLSVSYKFFDDSDSELTALVKNGNKFYALLGGNHNGKIYSIDYQGNIKYVTNLPFKLDESYNYIFFPYKGGFLIGGEGRLYYVTKKGEIIWSIPVEVDPSIYISAGIFDKENNLILALGGDVGTIKLIKIDNSSLSFLNKIFNNE